MKNSDRCEYGRCGGNGARATARSWLARLLLRVESTTSDRDWRVCEGCADLLTRTARSDGFDVTRRKLQSVSGAASAAQRARRKRRAKGLTRGKGRAHKLSTRLDGALTEERQRDYARALEIIRMRAEAKRVSGRRHT